MIMKTSIASGRGYCQKCMKPIKKGDKQLVVQGYRSAGRWCLKCIKEIVKPKKKKL